MDVITVKIRVLDSRLGTEFLFPEYVSNKFSGFFLKACIKRSVCLMVNHTILISTGISIDIIDKNTCFTIKSLIKKKKKSDIIVGHAFSFINFFSLNELKISFWNCSKKDVQINPGDNLAQLFINSNKFIKFIYK
ncbi:hypothetical protein [Buchnera aphidicola]|uniref:hypothetical protein n=1 Tax=Buchnera aphidicola TaxID=9 RepID=UPI00094D7247|nr:hypothetical protein [Buchnera aphidicola]